MYITTLIDFSLKNSEKVFHVKNMITYIFGISDNARIFKSKSIQTLKLLKNVFNVFCYIGRYLYTLARIIRCNDKKMVSTIYIFRRLPENALRCNVP